MEISEKLKGLLGHLETLESIEEKQKAIEEQTPEIIDEYGKYLLYSNGIKIPNKEKFNLFKKEESNNKEKTPEEIEAEKLEAEKLKAEKLEAEKLELEKLKAEKLNLESKNLENNKDIIDEAVNAVLSKQEELALIKRQEEANNIISEFFGSTLNEVMNSKNGDFLKDYISGATSRGVDPVEAVNSVLSTQLFSDLSEINVKKSKNIKDFSNLSVEDRMLKEMEDSFSI